MTKSQSEFDLLVIGGGISGAGIAADAAGRGLSVALLEKGDLASATSSWSSKLIHGVCAISKIITLSGQEIVEGTGSADHCRPHLVTPLAFQIPMLPESRSAILLRCGLILYDTLATRKHYSASERSPVSG